MPNHRFFGLLMSLTLLIAVSSCKIFQATQSGMSPEHPILLDTMDLVIATPPLPLRPTEPLHTDVVHTELDLRFNWEESSVIGKAKIQVRAHFLPIDTVVLDARGFELGEVNVSQRDSVYTPVYRYNNEQLVIALKHPLTRSNGATLNIEYRAYPSRLEGKGGNAITSSRGLYFINPLGTDSLKPTQIWTQGETEYNSGWFPCIDQPNEKHSQEVFITVDSNMATLSNGKLIYSELNADGTRTDYWKQALPHSTYLTMIAVGDFAIVKDSWRDKDVWYFVDHDHAEYAQQIFGNTPEMLEFYSTLLGVDYPWDKYHQVVVQDFVSGAMENTSAVIHGDFVQQTAREMIDGTHEDVIAHELFHHWFGNLVTAESWSQITMNEGFASYGEFLWWEHKYGENEARLHLQQDLKAYLAEALVAPKPLVRQRYEHPDDVFDRHSYQKGSRVLHMLRLELGDEVFFAGLRTFLNDNAYGSVEDAHLRLAMEEVSGRDLHWFFDQWFHRSGHPQMVVDYVPDTANNIVYVIFDQRNSEHGTFQIQVDVLAGNESESIVRRLRVEHALDTFVISTPFVPQWFVVDPWGDVLWELKENKSAAAMLAQLKHCNSFISQLRVLGHEMPVEDNAFTDYLVAMLGRDDVFWASKAEAARRIAEIAVVDTVSAISVLLEVYNTPGSSSLRAEALRALDSLSRTNPDMDEHFLQAVSDSSYLVMRTALEIQTERDPCAAMTLSERLSPDENKDALLWISRMHALCGKPASLEFFLAKGSHLHGLDKFMFHNDFTRFALMAGEEYIYDALVEQMGASALDSSTWWERMSSIQGLESAQAFYEARITELESSESPGQDEQLRLARLRNKKANLSALIEEARAMESMMDD